MARLYKAYQTFSDVASFELMTRTRGGYKSSQSSYERSTRDSGRRSTCGGYRYREANISNDDMEDDDRDEPLYQEDMLSRSNNWARGHSNMSPTIGGYTGQASQHRSIIHGNRESARDVSDNHEANISNHEVEHEHTDDELNQEDMSRSNRPKSDRMSLTRGENTSSRARRCKSKCGGGRRSIRSNNEHHDPNTLNDELGGEHANDFPRTSDRTRGPNRGTPMPADRSQRIEITIKNNTFGETFVSRDITATMKAYFDGPYPTFCSMPQPIRDGLWDRFMDKYVWPTANTINVYDTWKATAKDRYKDMMNDAREKAKRTSQSDNPVDWRGHGLRWIRAEHWDSLVNYWNTDKWKKNAKIAKENRLAQGQDGEMKKHTDGSVSFVITKKRLEKDMDHPMSQLEFFSHVHRKNHGLGDFVDKKSKRVHDTYKASIESKYGTVRDDQPEFDPDSWIDAVNGPSKGRVYGFCPRQPALHVLGTPNSPRSSILARDEEVNNLKTELAIARNTIDENNEKIDDLIVRLERVERNHKVEMRETVRSILGELNIPNFQFPSSSGSRNDDV